MKKPGGRLSVAVAVAMVVVVMDVVGALPTQPALHQPTNLTIEANHVEDHYLDDALGNWLDDFDTYTFMVNQGLDTDAEEGEHEEDSEAAVHVAEEEEDPMKDIEEEEEEEQEEWSAPIAVFTGGKHLLDPGRDYLVTVESLVAEEGSIFLTLSKYENQTTCGVGGLTMDEEVAQQIPQRPAGGGLDVTEGHTGGTDEDHTTFIAFGSQQEGDVPSPDTSTWQEVSQHYWWARGQLAGGGMLSITFTPPECGCLALSTYFALPVGNLTLVVGPQAYPDELQTLLCIDPLAAVSDHEYDHQEEEEEEEEEEEMQEEGEEEADHTQQPSALARVAARQPDEAHTETETEEAPQHRPAVSPRKRKMTREEKKMARKAKRQMKRQNIRQAGRRQARRQGAAGEARVGTRWNRKRNQRKKTKVWKKLHKRGRRGRHRLPAKHHRHHQDNGASGENMTHYHHSASPGLNTTANQQEERLVDFLLRDLHEGNTTLDDETDEESDVPEGGEAMAGQEEEGKGEEQLTPKQRRKSRRQRKKQLRKQKRKLHPPGIKFCCKQGVKHKKSLLEVESASDDAPPSCNLSSVVVSTFANHQFGIEEDTCTSTFTTCCDRFTQEIWDGIKAKKEARKEERKQRRKSRRQGRKHRRRQERRQRKGVKGKSDAHHENEDQMECVGEGEDCGRKK